MPLFGLFRKKKKDPLQEIRELLDGFELPSFPKAALQILETLRDPKSTSVEIAKKIAADPGIHLTVLKTVNSAAFGLTRRISSIEHAVALLGRARLESLVLPLAVRETLPKIETPCLDFKKFWLSACRRASLARQVAKLLHPATHVESFTAGLLQDMAIPVIMHVKKKRYCPTLENWNMEKGVTLDALEREKFGFDHQRVGVLMAEEWNLPEYLLNAIGKHHRLQDGVDPAVYLVSHIRYNSDLEGALDTDLLLEIAEEELKLSKETMIPLIEKAFSDAEELARIFI